MKQLSFASLEHQNKKVTTKREKFLNEMEQVIPWSLLLKLIKPHYPKGTHGRSVKPLATMLRIYFLQQWYALSDPAAEESLYDMFSMRTFAQTDLSNIPDETTILNFRHLIEKHKLSEQMLTSINAYLVTKNIKVSKGTMVDATIIHAPSSTKNKNQQRDPAMKSTRKNNQYFFGMKVHIGTDINTNVIHSAEVTGANVADVNKLHDLMREDDEVIVADAGYTGDKHRKAFREKGIKDLINHKRLPSHTKTKRKNLSATQKKNNHKIAKIRARVEHCFRIVKRQFGYQKVRYRGLEKNRVQVFALLGLANLYSQRHKLLA